MTRSKKWAIRRKLKVLEQNLTFEKFEKNKLHNRETWELLISNDYKDMGTNLEYFGNFGIEIKV